MKTIKTGTGDWVVIKLRLTPENRAELMDLKFANNFERLDDVISMLLEKHNNDKIAELPKKSQARRKLLKPTFN